MTSAPKTPVSVPLPPMGRARAQMVPRDTTPRGTSLPVSRPAAAAPGAAGRAREAIETPGLGMPVGHGPAPADRVPPAGTPSPPPAFTPTRQAEGASDPAGEAPSASSASSAGLKAIAAAMSEGELEEQVRALCADLHILRFHNPDSRKVRQRGLPDDILIGPCGVLWRELKDMRRKLTPEQVQVGADLLRNGCDWAVWRPDSLLSGRIQAELRAITSGPLGTAQARAGGDAA